MKYPDDKWSGWAEITGSGQRWPYPDYRVAGGVKQLRHEMVFINILSIPAVITRLYHAILDSYRKTGSRFIGGRSEGGAGADAETGPVTGTDNLIAFYDFTYFQT